eukprot:5289468-Pleurochrysis_carterae.AAC.1
MSRPSLALSRRNTEPSTLTSSRSLVMSRYTRGHLVASASLRMPCGTRTHSLSRHRFWRHRAPPPFASSRQIST